MPDERNLNQRWSDGSSTEQGSITTTNPLETTMIDSLKEFDDRAWESLFAYYQDRLLKDIHTSLRRRGMNGQFADDIAGETWLIAVEKIGELDCQDFETLYHWLRVIAYNRVRNLGRKKKPSLSIQDLEESQGGQNGSSLDTFMSIHGRTEPSPEQEIESREQRRQLERALSYLSPRDRELWLRRHCDGHDPAQIALDFDLKPRSISQNLLRNRKLLQGYLVGIGVSP
ncbi:MAG: sigma-70 family RNA polymerase sigma factor [Anaerolineae bacterium]|nr:sigma-70 family RNA polymerase sigma factor [Anaerolineae bacterium]